MNSIINSVAIFVNDINPKGLNALNQKIVQWHDNGNKVLEHTVGRISVLAFPFLAALDVSTGLISLPLKLVAWVISKPVLKDQSPIKFKDIVLTAWRVVIVVSLLPIFALTALINPYYGAKFYYAATFQDFPQTNKTDLNSKPEISAKPVNQEDQKSQVETKTFSEEIAKSATDKIEDVAVASTEVSILEEKNFAAKFQQFGELLSNLLKEPSLLNSQQIEVLTFFANISNETSRHRDSASKVIKESKLLALINDNGEVTEQNKQILIQGLVFLEAPIFKSIFTSKDLDEVRNNLIEIHTSERTHRNRIEKHLILLQDKTFKKMFKDYPFLKDLEKAYKSLLVVSEKLEIQIVEAIKNFDTNLPGTLNNLLKLCEECKNPNSILSQNLMILQEIAIIYENDFLKLQREVNIRDPEYKEKFDKIQKRYKFSVQDDPQMLFGELGTCGFQRTTRYKILMNEIPKKFSGLGKTTIDQTIGWRINISNELSRINQFLNPTPMDLKKQSQNILDFKQTKKDSTLTKDEVQTLSDQMNKLNSTVGLYTDTFANLYMSKNKDYPKTSNILNTFLKKREALRSAEKQLRINSEMENQYKVEEEFAKTKYHKILK